MKLEPSIVTRPFWEGVNRGELLVPTCLECGKRHFTPRPRCPFCRSGSIEWQRSSGEGEVYSATVVCRKPADNFDVPFALALITLDGWEMMSHVVDITPADILIGMPVRVRFDSWGEMTRPVFIPRHKESA